MYMPFAQEEESHGNDVRNARSMPDGSGSKKRAVRRKNGEKLNERLPSQGKEREKKKKNSRGKVVKLGLSRDS
jgi:hypothetical protein